MKESTVELVGIFGLKIRHYFAVIYTLMSLYVLIPKNIYINSIYFAATTCETTLARLTNFDQNILTLARHVLCYLGVIAFIVKLLHQLSFGGFYDNCVRTRNIN